MQAAVYKGASVVEVESIPVPEIGAGEILIRVESCGICHTDLKKIAYNLLAGAAHLRARDGGRGRGRGRGRHASIKPGDRVIVFHHIPCGKCFYCGEEVVRAMPGV